MTTQADLRNTRLTNTAEKSPIAMRRRSARFAIVVAIVAIGAVVAGASIVTRGDSRMVPSEVPSAGASAAPAVASLAVPQGYWNAYLNEWVELGAVESTTPQGYWNAYLNEWVELGAVESTTPQGYWNAYLNEWVELGAVESTTPQGYWNAYLNEWVELGAVESTTPQGYWNAYLNEWVTFDPR